MSLNEVKVRKQVIVFLRKIISMNCTIIEEELKDTCYQIEKGIYEYASFSSNRWDKIKDYYTQRSLLVIHNINPKDKIQNLTLLNRLLNKELEPFYIGRQMTAQEMFPERNKLGQIEAFAKIDPNKLPDGIFKCGKCKSYKTSYVEIFSRSADEPSVKKIFCHNCENRWKITM